MLCKNFKEKLIIVEFFKIFTGSLHHLNYSNDIIPTETVIGAIIIFIFGGSSILAIKLQVSQLMDILSYHRWLAQFLDTVLCII